MLPIPIYQIQIKVHFLFPRRKKHVCGCVETDRPFLGIIRSFNKMGGKKSKTFLIMQRKLEPADLVYLHNIGNGLVKYKSVDSIR